MSYRRLELDPQNPADAGMTMQRIVADIYGQIAKEMDNDARCELVAAYIMAAAGWLAAILGPDGCIAALERAIANLRARRNALELHRAQPARGVH